MKIKREKSCASLDYVVLQEAKLRRMHNHEMRNSARDKGLRSLNWECQFRRDTRGLSIAVQQHLFHQTPIKMKGCCCWHHLCHSVLLWLRDGSSKPKYESSCSVPSFKKNQTCNSCSSKEYPNQKASCRIHYMKRVKPRCLQVKLGDSKSKKVGIIRMKWSAIAYIWSNYLGSRYNWKRSGQQSQNHVSLLLNETGEKCSDHCGSLMLPYKLCPSDLMTFPTVSFLW